MYRAFIECYYICPTTGHLLDTHNKIQKLCLGYLQIKAFNFQINQPTRCNNSSSYYLTFMYSSTCFGRPHSHHQECNNCSSSLWFYLWNLLVAVMLVVVGPARPQPTALLTPRSNGKIRGCYCSC